MYNDYFNMRECVTKEYRSRLATCEEGFNDDDTIYYYRCCDGLFGVEGATVNDCEQAKHDGSWEPDKCGCEWVLVDISKEGVNNVVDYITSWDFMGFHMGYKNKDLSCLDGIKNYVSVLKYFKDYVYLPKDNTLYKELLYIVDDVLHALYPEYEGRIDSKLEHKVCKAVIRYYNIKG